MNARWPDEEGEVRPAAAQPLDVELRQAAELMLEEHWALRSLRRERRAQILATASGTPADTPEAALPRVRRPRRGATTVAGAVRPEASGVTVADVVHLAGAYDLAGRDAIALLDVLTADDAPAPPAEEATPGAPRAAPHAALGERRGLQRAGVEAQLTVAAARAFTLHAALPLHDAAPAAATGEHPAAGEHPGADEADDDARADESLLHRLLHLAALAEVGHRRADWVRWLDRHAAELAVHPCVAPVLAPTRPDAPPDGTCTWDVRFRALVIAAWIAVLPRSGPSGLDDAMELLARLREERAAREPAWLEALERDGGEAALVRARFALFALGHLADAAVETLLFLRHGDAYADAVSVDRVVNVRLRLAREAASGDLQWDALLVWLREAVRLVIARRSSQLEMSVGA